MGLFDFLKPKKSEKELMFEKMNKEMFPNGDNQIANEVNSLSKKLNKSYSTPELKSLYLYACALFYMSPQASKQDITASVQRKHASFSTSDIESIYDFIKNKRTSQRTGIEQDKLNLLSELERNAMKGTTGYNVDELPNSHGEFGYVKTNPIPVNGMIAKYAYLDDLVTSDGKEIKYNRVEGVTAANIENTIDKIAVMDKNGNFITHLYFSCYHKKMSEKAPKGFRFK